MLTLSYSILKAGSPCNCPSSSLDEEVSGREGSEAIMSDYLGLAAYLFSFGFALLVVFL